MRTRERKRNTESELTQTNKKRRESEAASTSKESQRLYSQQAMCDTK